MRTATKTLATRSLLVFAATLMALTSGTGCVGAGQRVSNWYYGLAVKAQRHHELADVRQDTRVALAEQEQAALQLAAEREVEAARYDAERRRLEMEFCQANQEALHQKIRSNLRESVETKLAFNVEQNLEVGELEVDVEQLQALLKEREQEQLRQPPLPVKQPCSCCDRPCGCEPGMLRRHCPRCRHKPCEAERDCGGPQALALIEQQPLKQPLRPAEIPMKLPVRLNFGFQQPEVERARIRRVPDLPPEALRQPCDRCTDPSCPGRCTQPVGDAALRPLYDYQHDAPVAPAVDPRIGPAPVPETEARQTSAPHGIRLGAKLNRRNHSYGRLAAMP